MSTQFLQNTLEACSTQYELNALNHEMTLENHRFDALADQLEAAAMHQASPNAASLEYGSDYDFTAGIDEANVKFSISAEYFKHLLKKAWQMIWNMLKRFFRWIAEWLSKLFAGVKRMRGDAQKLVKYAERLREDGRVPTSTSITVGGASRLHMGGKVNPAELQVGLENVTSVLGMALDTHLSGSNDLFDMIEDVTKQLHKIDTADIRQIEQAVMELNTQPHRIRMDIHAQLHRVRDKELPGGYVAQVGSVTTDEDGRPKNMPSVELKTVANRPIYEKTDMVPAKPDEIIAMGNAAIAILDEIAKRERTVKRLADDFKSMNEQANKVLGNAVLADKIQEKLHPHTYRMLIWFYRMGIPGSLNNVFTYQYAVARTTLQYLHTSARDYA